MGQMSLETVAPRQRRSIYHLPNSAAESVEVVAAPEANPSQSEANIHAWVGNSDPQLTRKLPIWLVSLILHVLLLVGLALLTIAGDDTAVIELDVGIVADKEFIDEGADLSILSFEDDEIPEQLDLEELVEPENQPVESFEVASASPQFNAESQGNASSASGFGSGGGDHEGFGEMVTRLKRTGLDIAIVFDSTGSMRSELQEVKNDIERICNTLFELIPQTRISICTYRDRGEDFIVKGQTLTKRVDQIVTFLDEISAKGGGDEPEAVDAGLSWAIKKNAWRSAARKVIVVFGDASPHDNRIDECLKMASDFQGQRRGIVSTVTCQRNTPLESFTRIAYAGGGSSFLSRDERQLMSQLIVLVFGDKHRQKVIEAFGLLDQEPEKGSSKERGSEERDSEEPEPDKSFRDSISVRALGGG